MSILVASGSFTAASAGAAVVPAGRYNLTLSGTFVGSVTLERSHDGTTWVPLGKGDGTPVAFTAPISVVVDEFETGIRHRVRCTVFTSGTINWRISGGGVGAVVVPPDPLNPPPVLPGLVFVADPRDPNFAPDDGTGKVRFLRHLLDGSKFMTSPDDTSRPIIATGGMTGSQRVLALGPGRYLRTLGTGFSGLIGAWDGPWATNSATVCMAAQLPGDANWAEPAVWLSGTGNQWVDIIDRDTTRIDARIHDHVAGTGNNGRTDGDFSVQATGSWPGWRLLTLVESGPSLDFRIDGVSRGTATYTGSYVLTGYDFLINATLGQGTLVLDTTGAASTAQIGGIIVCNTALAGANLTAAEAWVKASAGIP
jgi:hypothetical protein